MIEVQIQVPSSINTKSLVTIVENVCATNDLVCSLRGALASYPGSIHWHFKRGKQKGTLEITWWEKEHRLWFKVASGRTSEWINETILPLKEQLESALF